MVGYSTDENCIENTYAWDEQGNKGMLKIEHLEDYDYDGFPFNYIEIIEILHFPRVYKCWGKEFNKKRY